MKKVLGLVLIFLMLNTFIILAEDTNSTDGDYYTKDEIDEMLEEQDDRLDWLEDLFDKLLGYFGFMSSSVKKKAVCGYAQEQNITNYVDLGYNCTLSYRNLSSGIRTSCKCIILNIPPASGGGVFVTINDTEVTNTTNSTG